MLCRTLPTLLAVSLALVGCGGDSATDDAGGGGDMDSDTPPDLEAVRRGITANLAEAVILPTLRDFATAATALEEATATLDADPSAANRETAQAAWRDAMAVWQQAEMMQIGPAGMGGTECPVVGGMDLRDQIYSWDLTSECRIDQETVDETYADVDALGAELVNVRGLDALEYLLFVPDGSNSCSSLSPINAEGSWAALGDAEVTARRAAYAHAAATLIARQATSLRDLWEPDEGGFATDLATAGQDGSAYSRSQSAFNDMGGAMLYLDIATRDMKLAEPAGIAGCMEATCFDSLEHPHAHVSVASVIANVRGFQRLFLGEQPGTVGQGWDDLLIEVGAEDLATDLTEAIAAAIAALEALGTDDLTEAVTSDAAAVMAAYEAVGAAQRLFKTDVFTVLDIEPTTCRIGDND